MKVLILSLAAAGLAATSASAATYGIDRREARQEHRIYNGAANGDLSYREMRRLTNGQVHIRNLERRAKADGVVTPWERRRIQQALNVESRRIYRLKHN